MMDITDVERAALADPEVMAAVNASRSPVSRPGIGIAIDRRKLKQLREAALLERIDLSDLTKHTELCQIAAANGIDGYSGMDNDELTAALKARGVQLPRHVGISRDAIAKIENGDRLRPKISTLRILIDTLNVALADRGEPPISIRDLYAGPDDGEQDPVDAGTEDEPA